MVNAPPSRTTQTTGAVPCWAADLLAKCVSSRFLRMISAPYLCFVVSLPKGRLPSDGPIVSEDKVAVSIIELGQPGLVELVRRVVHIDVL